MKTHKSFKSRLEMAIEESLNRLDAILRHQLLCVGIMSGTRRGAVTGSACAMRAAFMIREPLFAAFSTLGRHAPRLPHPDARNACARRWAIARGLGRLPLRRSLSAPRR